MFISFWALPVATIIWDHFMQGSARHTGIQPIGLMTPHLVPCTSPAEYDYVYWREMLQPERTKTSLESGLNADNGNFSSLYLQQ
jgi:hypothetical protein